ncbi:MAG: hypothetical protein NT084_13605 [Bacteroidetes bacterium]|nr:hypothetical protein [Bacteroidota bacterium]
MKIKAIAFLFFVMTSLMAFAQEPPITKKHDKIGKEKSSVQPDSIIPCFSLSLGFAYQIPGGDLQKRFGPNSSSGASLFYKTKQNVFFGFQWSYLFGTELRGENPLDSISTSTGFVIDREGKFADIRMFERGFSLGLSCGKIFNSFLSPNKNSGILLTGGVGYLQHKIKIYDNGARAPQLTKEYLKGYDRLTSGISTSEFIGYWFMSKNRYVSFYGGFEFIQGFTKSRRSWDYNLMRPDTENRIDLLSGLRIGWVIPLYRKNVSNKYYY